MAKVDKKAETADPAKLPGTLGAAYAAFERGDAVQARALAKQVLAGHGAPEDAAVAKRLSGVLSTEVSPVNELPEDVAAELVRRTNVPPNPYLFAALVVLIFGGLLVLALTRYRG